MTKYIWISVAVIALILILAYKQAPKESPVASTESSPVEETKPSEPVVSQSANIKVSQPQPDSLVSSPLLVKGQARTFENTFQMALKDADGKEIVKKTATYTAPSGGQFGDFGELLLFDNPKTDKGTLEVFDLSAKDGAIQDLVRIPVKFK